MSEIERLQAARKRAAEQPTVRSLYSLGVIHYRVSTASWNRVDEHGAGLAMVQNWIDRAEIPAFAELSPAQAPCTRS